MLLHHKISLKRRLFSSGGWAFFTMLVWEGVECLLEYAIAYFISSTLTLLLIKLVTTFLVVTTTQTIIKPIERFLSTFIKKIIYKKGDDKVKALKTVWEYIKSNKCSIAVVLLSGLIGASGSSIIDVDQLPAITVGKEKVIEAVIQEEDVLATEIVYGDPIFADEVIWEKEPVIADAIIWEKEPVYADEVIWEKEPVIADKLTFIANTVIYEEDGTTVKYNIGDIVPNSEIDAYTDKVDVYQVGAVIVEGTILYDVGDLIIEGVVKHNKGDIVEEGIIKYNIGDYIETEIIYNVGDVMVAKGTVIEEAKTIPATNITPYLYYAVLSIVLAVAGVFFEKPKDYLARKELDTLKKQAKKEIVAEENKAVIEEEQKKAEAEKVKAEAEKAKIELENRIKLDKIKADIRAGNI